MDFDELEDIQIGLVWWFGQPPFYDCSMAESDPGAMEWEPEE